MNNYNVAVRNDLARASYTLSITEKRLLLCFISIIPPKVKIESTTIQRLDIRRYASLFNVEPKHALAEIKKALITLPERMIYIKQEDSEIKAINWISKEVVLIDDGYTLGIKWYHGVIPYISLLARNFVSFKLDEVKNLRSYNALRLYEFISCELGAQSNVKRKEAPYIAIEDIRFMLAIGENKHLATSNLINSIIKPAIQAINRDTPMIVDMELYKRGKKVIGFWFKVPLIPNN